MCGAQFTFHLLGKTFHRIFHRLISFYFQNQMHSTLKVQTEVNLLIGKEFNPPFRQLFAKGG